MAKDLKLNGERVRQIPLFSNLNEYEAETLIKITSIKVFKKDEAIFMEGSPGDALYLILDGTVDIVKRVDDKTFKTLARFKKDHAFGEMTLIFNEVSNRNASAIARERTRVLIIFKEDFKQLIDFGSIIAYKVTLNLCRILSERLSRVDRELVEIINEADEKTRAVLETFMKRRNSILQDEEEEHE